MPARLLPARGMLVTIYYHHHYHWIRIIVNMVKYDYEIGAQTCTSTPG